MSATSYEALWFDPGGTTGWAVMSVHRQAIEDPDYRILENIIHWQAGEFTGPWPDQVDAMLELADAWPDAKLGVEDFYLRQMAVDLSPVIVSSAFQYQMARNSRRHKGSRPRPVIKQMPSLAMSVTDARLKAWGFYTQLTGQEHARDAMRHCLTWLRRAKEILASHRVT